MTRRRKIALGVTAAAVAAVAAARYWPLPADLIGRAAATATTAAAVTPSAIFRRRVIA